MANWSLPTVADTWANILAFFKNRDDDLAKMLDPATTSPTNLPTSAIRWNSANEYWELYNGTSWAALTATYAISISGSAGSVPYSGITSKPTTLAGYGITDAQPLDADLTAIAAFASTGFAARTASNTWAQRTLAAPAAGITITNPAGIAGNPTLVLANDLAALEGLGSTGIAVRSATDTWVQRTITGTTDRITVTNGNGVSGNPTLDIGAQVATLNTEDQALTGGVIVTSKSLGTISSGTVTPDPGDRPQQHYTNGGAHTLAPSSNNGSMLVDVTNNVSAGAITTTGFTKVIGDAFTTVNGDKFRCYISIGNAGSLLSIQAMQ